MYTSLLLMIIFSAYVSSFSLEMINGRTFYDDKYELILGGPPDAMTIIDGLSFAGVKSVRELTPNEILAFNLKPMNENEIEKKQEEEERERIRKVEERKREQAEKEEEGRQIKQNLHKTLKQQPKRVAKKTQRGSEAAQNITKRLKSNNGQQILISNTQNTPPKRLVRRINSNPRRKLNNMNIINV